MENIINNNKTLFYYLRHIPCFSRYQTELLLLSQNDLSSSRYFCLAEHRRSQCNMGVIVLIAITLLAEFGVHLYREMANAQALDALRFDLH